MPKAKVITLADFWRGMPSCVDVPMDPCESIYQDCDTIETNLRLLQGLQERAVMGDMPKQHEWRSCVSAMEVAIESLRGEVEYLEEERGQIT